jgi:hypothetical protein
MPSDCLFVRTFRRGGAKRGAKGEMGAGMRRVGLPRVQRGNIGRKCIVIIKSFRTLFKCFVKFIAGIELGHFESCICLCLIYCSGFPLMASNPMITDGQPARGYQINRRSSSTALIEVCTSSPNQIPTLSSVR